ncbi:globin family protein [Phaeodactylibacter luteus]|uniref:Group 1 truncated hemoglobin n=1 Tax=Phaeodactylibacter luteus TaxID=1564516 RepID=A0A5C6S1Z2_9BACT|nr:group 1 truncated hemoglobin [Phaeodactylibacter luteus]TXB68413.1 group 1 truncated hemoglobin [Phaeodactylibacter luteus]
MNTKFFLFLLGFACLTTFVACDDDEGMMDEPTLYERLGGTEMVSDPATGGMIEAGRLGLRSVVDSTIFVIAADPELQPYFASLLMEVGNGNLTNLAVLSESLTDFFCVATGAENFTYDGMDMVSAHDPAQNPRMALKADNASYDAFINAVVAGANQNSVPEALIMEVGALLETLRADVVQR